MNPTFQHGCLLPFLLMAFAGQPAHSQTTATTEASAQTTSSTAAALLPCAELPTGVLSDAELARLVPEGTPGRVRVAWKTESQEATYGFNILRADSTAGPYVAINQRIIPGEGTSNVPKGYCYEDVTVNRGQIYFYQIEEVTNAGTKTIVEGTAGTQVKVKTVSEERAWLKKKAAAAVSVTSP